MVRDKVKKVVKMLIRRHSPVVFGDLSRVAPVSHEFGLERGYGIPRCYIDGFIARNATSIAGEVLEVGEPRYARSLGHAARCTVLAPSAGAVQSVDGSSDVLIADLSNPSSLPEERFDCFICTQTLNFIYDVKAAVEGAHRLLKPGGTFLGTVAGIQQISRFDMDRWGDYWRFTNKSLDRLLHGTFGEDVTVSCMGNALAAQLILQGVCVEDLPDRSVLTPVDEDYQAIIGFVARK